MPTTMTFDEDQLDIATNIYSAIIEEYGHEWDVDTFHNIKEELLPYIGKWTDVTLDIDGSEYRIMHEGVAATEFEDSIKDLVDERIGDLSKIPWWISFTIDYETTAKNLLDSDGTEESYGAQFGPYDGKCHSYKDYYFFKID